MMTTEHTHDRAPATDRAAVGLADFDFDLPEELIAQIPAERRDAARLLVVDRQTAGLQHSGIAALPTHLRPGDLLVVNDTKVLPARLLGKGPGGGAVELLLIRPVESRTNVWLCLGRPSRRLRPDATVLLPAQQQGRVVASLGDGFCTVAFANGLDVPGYLSEHGELPLPPYIRRPDGLLASDHARYQTIFADQPGAIAAPTAGLHFTAELLAALAAAGIEMARLTLHVGPATFLPIRAGNIQAHKIDPEWTNIPVATADAIRRAKRDGRRVIAVGTTTTRALESAATGDGDIVRAGEAWADRFILPGYRFQVIDALFTNFHLPGSTLLLLVAALLGRETLLAAYRTAVGEGYRFYSYGDAMLIQ